MKCEEKKNTNIGRIFLEQRVKNEKGTGEKWCNKIQWDLDKVCYMNLAEGC